MPPVQSGYIRFYRLSPGQPDHPVLTGVIRTTPDYTVLSGLHRIKPDYPVMSRPL